MKRRGPKAKVNYWSSRKAFGTSINGKQYTLAAGEDDRPDGPTYRAAVARFLSLISIGTADEAGDKNTIKVVCELYLRHIETRLAPGSVKMRQERLAAFVRMFGELPARELSLPVVYGFVDRMRVESHAATGGRAAKRWGDTASRMFVVSLNTAMRWAVKMKLLTSNPVEGIEIPAGRRRVADVIVSVEQFKAILAAARPHIRRLLVCFEATGARPGELLNARAENFSADLGAIVYPARDRRSTHDTGYRHKTSHLGKDRVIVLTGEAIEVVRGLVEANPTGPIFRRPNGKPITKATLKRALSVIRETVGMPNLVPYSFRHTYATAWIESGRSIDILAEALGNTPDMLRKTYSHLHQRRPAIRAAIEEFRSRQDQK